MVAECSCSVKVSAPRGPSNYRNKQCFYSGGCPLMQAELDWWNGLNYCHGNNEINDKNTTQVLLVKCLIWAQPQVPRQIQTIGCSERSSRFVLWTKEVNMKIKFEIVWTGITAKGITATLTGSWTENGSEIKDVMEQLWKSGESCVLDVVRSQLVSLLGGTDLKCNRWCIQTAAASFWMAGKGEFMISVCNMDEWKEMEKEGGKGRIADMAPMLLFSDSIFEIK